jgi:hypothetical protein
MKLVGRFIVFCNLKSYTAALDIIETRFRARDRPTAFQKNLEKLQRTVFLILRGVVGLLSSPQAKNVD